MKIHLRKGVSGALLPDTEEDKENLKSFRVGEVVSAEVKRPRNYKFHKKVFSFFSYCYDNWDQPEIETKHGTAIKSFSRFYKDMLVLAGHYEQVIRLDGTVRVEAKSISFAKLEEHEFDKLFEVLIAVAMKHVLKTYTREDIDMVLDEIAGYAE